MSNILIKICIFCFFQSQATKLWSMLFKSTLNRTGLLVFLLPICSWRRQFIWDCLQHKAWSLPSPSFCKVKRKKLCKKCVCHVHTHSHIQLHLYTNIYTYKFTHTHTHRDECITVKLLQHCSSVQFDWVGDSLFNFNWKENA